MNENQESSRESTLSRIDLLAEAFEDEIHRGEYPRIEDFLAKAQDIRQPLLAELLAIEFELRRKAGETVQFQQYYDRFPDDSHTINDVIGANAASTHADGNETISQPAVDSAIEFGVPKQIGRYKIESHLGRGGFGDVYLATDQKLKRHVALKVPRADRFSSNQQVEEFLSEARTAASLKHPGLVAIYDVQEEDGLPYLVQEYIDGENLGSWFKQIRPGYSQLAQAFKGIAEALGHLHNQGFVHADVKPANVLMNRQHQPHVADFGVAVHSSKLASRQGLVFGTPAYMSPEQVRGESHLFDGRTDIWAMGIMFYELLTGQRPFQSSHESSIFDVILSSEPEPLRRVEKRVPRELERICLRCLGRRRTDRFRNADALIDDLNSWLENASSSELPNAGHTLTNSQSKSSSSTSIASSIVPKGLRSFDADDADFFLELLAGARDRNGIPESIRFWKTRIEEYDKDQTFPIGLIYGPSGCGKSSLVKAGLLPRLSLRVKPIYVEATPDTTEQRILKSLHQISGTIDTRNTPESTFTQGNPNSELIKQVDSNDLGSVIANLRRSLPAGEKILIVIDQFEQWLHTHREPVDSELLKALRQCDGAKVQCIVMIRDDFWMAMTRVLAELEVDLVQGRNFAAVDLFSVAHAEKVLTAFGLAYGTIPRDDSGEIDLAREFVKQAVVELAVEGRLVCVQLALFAEMMKSREWKPETLKQLGGSKGLGFHFLEETFSADTALPAHVHHASAARAVLSMLVPADGTNIKAHMRSYNELMSASGYVVQPDEFAGLLKVLDSDLRLITPTEPVQVVDTDSRPVEESHGRYFQLSHDYLIPALRSWLDQKQQETWRGRASLLLSARSETWNYNPTNRVLPAWWEYLNIKLMTSRRDWAAPQQKMMRRATVVHGTRWGLTIAILLLVGIVVQQWSRHDQQQRLRSQVANTVNLLEKNRGVRARLLIEDLVDLPSKMVLADLDSRFADADDIQKLPLAFALAEFGKPNVDYLIDQVPAASGEDASNFAHALKHDRESSLEAIHARAKDCTSQEDWSQKTRLAVLSLYLGDESIAAEMLLGGQDSSESEEHDPVQRTEFIALFPEFSGDLDELAEIVRDSQSPSLRSGISLAVGQAKDMSPQTLKTWSDLLKHWYKVAPDSGTHGSILWTLSQWNQSLPEIAATRSPPPDRDWWHTQSSLRMVRIPSGNVSSPDASLTIDHSFWISDREVPVTLFEEFNRELPEHLRAVPPALSFYDKTQSEFVEITPSQRDNFPVTYASWEHAVLFCNWLSEKEELDPYYLVESLYPEDWEANPFADVPARGRRFSISIVPDANGFRLPTESEWEYACRAYSTTHFFCGDNGSRLSDYAVIDEKSPSFAASKQCNLWGLFDMHGNVAEWCWDKEGKGDLRNPEGENWDIPGITTESVGDYRVYRGFGFAGDADRNRSWSRFVRGAGIEEGGIRVVCNASVDRVNSMNSKPIPNTERISTSVGWKPTVALVRDINGIDSVVVYNESRLSTYDHERILHFARDPKQDSGDGMAYVDAQDRVSFRMQPGDLRRPAQLFQVEPSQALVEWELRLADAPQRWLTVAVTEDPGFTADTTLREFVAWLHEFTKIPVYLNVLDWEEAIEIDDPIFPNGYEHEALEIQDLLVKAFVPFSLEWSLHRGSFRISTPLPEFFPEHVVVYRVAPQLDPAKIRSTILSEVATDTWEPQHVSVVGEDLLVVHHFGDVHRQIQRRYEHQLVPVCLPPTPMPRLPEHQYENREFDSYVEFKPRAISIGSLLEKVKLRTDLKVELNQQSLEDDGFFDTDMESLEYSEWTYFGGPIDLETALNKLLLVEVFRLAWSAKGRTIVLTSVDEMVDNPTSLTFDLSAIEKRGIDPNDIKNAISNCILPDRWQSEEGYGHISLSGNSLRISHTFMTQLKIARLLAEIELAMPQ